MLFSLMVFLLISMIFGLYIISSDQDYSVNESVSSLNAFRRVSDKYANIRNSIVVLNANEAQKQISQRMLPFTYGIDGNVFSAQFDTPISQGRVKTYLESLEVFRIFVEDSNYEKQFEGLNVDVNSSGNAALQDGNWDTNRTHASFLVQPQCLQYTINDKNTIFGFSCPDYNFSNVGRIDVNFTFSSVDFNSTWCEMNIGAGLPSEKSDYCYNFNQAYNPADGNTFVNITLLDSNCSQCALAGFGNPKKISANLNPAYPSRIKIKCVQSGGAACTTHDLGMNFGGTVAISYSGTKIPTNVSLTFDSPITSFTYSDASISVRNEIFGTRRWN